MLSTAFAAETVVQFEPLSASQSAIELEAGSEEALDLLNMFPATLDADIDGLGMQQVDVDAWVPDKPYDADVADIYVFTPTFDDAVWDASLIDEAQIPTITVELLDAESLLMPAATTTYTLPADFPIVLGPGDDDAVITGDYTGAGNAITALEGYNGTITLAGVDIDVSSDIYSAALVIEGSGSVANITNYVNVVLQSGTTNTLVSGNCRAGLEVDAGAQVTISGPGGTLNAVSGNNPIVSGYGAGIGAGYLASAAAAAARVYLTGGNVVIMSGTINATAGFHGAGIGGSGYGGSPKYSGHVIIYGGNITSNGGAHGAGIGGGCGNNLGGGATGTTGVLLVLPPAQISATSAGNYANVGAMHVAVYIGDPAAPLVQVHTEDFTPNADIFMDLSNLDAVGPALIQTRVPVTDVDLNRIFLGNTGSTGIADIHMVTHVPVAFWTEVLSPAGTPYEAFSVIVDGDMTIVLIASGESKNVSPLTSAPAIPQAGDSQQVLALVAMCLLFSALIVLLPIRLRLMKRNH